MALGKPRTGLKRNQPAGPCLGLTASRTVRKHFLSKLLGLRVLSRQPRCLTGHLYLLFPVLPHAGLPGSWSKFKFWTNWHLLQEPPSDHLIYSSQAAPPGSHGPVSSSPRCSLLSEFFFLILLSEPLLPLRCRLRKSRDPVCLAHRCTCATWLRAGAQWSAGNTPPHTHLHRAAAAYVIPDSYRELTGHTRSTSQHARRSSGSPTPWAQLSQRPSSRPELDSRSPEAMGTLLSEPGTAPAQGSHSALGREPGCHTPASVSGAA